MCKICVLTGLPKEETPIKQMCINCTSLSYDKETKSFLCVNEDVMEIGRNKVIEAAKNIGFDIDSIKLKPMALKNPQKKCNNYVVDMDRIMSQLNEIFLVEQTEE